jgi:sulfoxide reductase heme-binding subunit YedZ
VQTTRANARIKHHTVLTVIAALLLWAIYAIVPGDDQKYLWSMATAYTSIILLGVTLILGPLNVLKNKNNPVSSDLRRDIGIWCGLTGIVHVIVGIQVHMGNIWLYFFKAVEGDESFQFRDDLFGAANYTGFIAGAILLVLLLISNDVSMKVLRPGKWKRFQQFSYLFFILTLVHGIMYQVIEKRMLAFIISFACLMIVPLLVQIKGFLSVNRKSMQPK